MGTKGDISSALDPSMADKELSNASTPSTTSLEPTSDEPSIRAVRRKVDYRLLAYYSVAYLFMRINVTNATNIAIMNAGTPQNIKTQLGNITSGQWAWIISIFFYPYALFEPPSTLLLKRFTPRVWMSRIMLTWGIVSMCQAATTNYAGMLACRFFLGLAEAGFYPGVLFHLSFWYPASNLPLRIAIFYSFGVFSGAVSGLLAYGISYMNNLNGLSGWQWMFILEGLPPLILSFIAWVWLPNFPVIAADPDHLDTSLNATTQTAMKSTKNLLSNILPFRSTDSTFLTPIETRLLITHLPATQPTATTKTWTTTEVLTLFHDPTFYTFNLLWLLHSIGGWGVSLVLPTVIYDLHLQGSSAVTQLMTIPTYAFGVIFMCIFGGLIHERILSPWPVCVGLEVVVCACYVVLLTVEKAAVKYVFVTLATACVSCVYPLMWPERIKAARGTTGVGVSVGVTNACAQLSGIVGPQLDQSRFGLGYEVSFGASIGLLAGAVGAMGVTWWVVRRREREVGGKVGVVVAVGGGTAR